MINLTIGYLKDGAAFMSTPRGMKTERNDETVLAYLFWAVLIGVCAVGFSA